MFRRPHRTAAANEGEDEGVVFPAGADGRRSSRGFSQAVFADALAAVSRERAERAAAQAKWQARYPDHVAALVRESIESPENAMAVARAGLDSLHERLEFLRGGQATPLARATGVERRAAFESVTLRGTGDSAPRPLAIPYRDEILSGDALARRLERWERQGVIEPSHAHAIGEVAAHPEWLDLSDRSVALLGASAEVGPLASLAGWRARILAIDLPGARGWKRIAKLVGRGNATLIAPVRADRGPAAAGSSRRAVAQADGALADSADAFAGDASALEGAGANLLADLPELADWLASADGPLTVGAYAYLDGAMHVRVAAAMDALMAALAARRGDVSLAALATPTDVYAVPREAVDASRTAWSMRGPGERLWQAPIASASGGRFFQPNHPGAGEPGDTPGYGICNSLVLQQGPNYALAKRLQQWRALAARADGVRVSINVAPSTTTRSVVSNRALRAAFAGAHHFGVESFESATTSALMAAMLVYDLRSDESAADPARPLAHPLELLMHGANHGGMWRMPFSARTALPFAALLGFVRRSGR